MAMKKIIGFLLLIGVIVWGCSDDDEKRVGDYELPSDFFYQTVWKGNLRYMTSFRKNLQMKSALYFVEGKVFHLSRDEVYLYDPYGYWFLTYCNEVSDSLIFEQRAYNNEPITMTLTKVSLDGKN